VNPTLSSGSALGDGERRQNRPTGSPPGESHLAQAIGQATIQPGYRALYRETHKLLDDLAEAPIDGTRKERMELSASVPLLIIDDLD
jgi:DNA replication protein DnaC